MATTELKVGQTLPLSIEYLDQNGKPMATNPVLDAPPVWANIPSAADAVTPAADGLTASVAGLAVGTDTVRVSLTVGGAQFAATLDITVAEAPAPPMQAQTLTSIGIVAGTPL